MLSGSSKISLWEGTQDYNLLKAQHEAVFFTELYLSLRLFYFSQRTKVELMEIKSYSLATAISSEDLSPVRR